MGKIIHRGVVKRKPGHLYYIDASGHVCEAKMARGGKKKKAAKKKSKSFEETLWDSANKLRGNVESSEYKHVVLSLIFLKFASDKFEERKQQGKPLGWMYL